MAPKVSVILCVYNELEYLDKAVNSIIQQSFTDWECIIVVDSIEKEIVESVLKYKNKDKRLQLHFNEVNLGLTKSLNIGINLARGEYIARMDADDIAHRNRFSKQVEYLDKNLNISVLGTWAEIINNQGNIISNIRLNSNNEHIKKGLLVRNQFVHSSIMLRKNVFDTYGLYNETYRRSQDYELWLRIRSKVNFHNMQEFLLLYRRHSESITNKNNIEQRLNGISMMYFFVQRNTSQLSIKENISTFVFFLKQFYKIIKLTYKQ